MRAHASCPEKPTTAVFRAVNPEVPTATCRRSRTGRSPAFFCRLHNGGARQQRSRCRYHQTQRWHQLLSQHAPLTLVAPVPRQNSQWNRVLVGHKCAFQAQFSTGYEQVYPQDGEDPNDDSPLEASAVYSPRVRKTLFSGRVLLDDNLSWCASISSYFGTVVSSSFGTICTTL